MCLTMMTAGIVELLGEFPAGVEIDEVVVAEFFALELGGSGDAEAGAVGVEGGALVGVFAIAERLREWMLMRRVDGRLRAAIARLDGLGWLWGVRRSCRACWRSRRRRRRWWRRPAWRDASVCRD